MGLKKDKFEKLSIEINEVVKQEQALISSQNIFENNYKISDSSYVFAPDHNHERVAQDQVSRPIVMVPVIVLGGIITLKEGGF